MIEAVIFYMFAFVLMAAAAACVSVRQPVLAVLSLILCFFNAAGLMVLLGAEFLAFVVLIVYVGAVAVLFLFVVMMLDVRAPAAEPKKRQRFLRPAFAVVTAILFLEILVVVFSSLSASDVAPVIEADFENTRLLGQVLYTDYIYPFQMAGLLLLVGMIGAMALTLTKRKEVKRQKLWDQLDRRAGEVLEVRSVKTGEGLL
ncbi:MAG: NADH-quinone oxidoreductase subunit J [Alphaproteobacteria bacterium]|nr:NADH-quinone oxidoreductase subunit J [Alphaproteobacteria bacterium]